MEPSENGTCSVEDSTDPKVRACKRQLWGKLLGEWVADSGGYKNVRLVVTKDGLEVNGRLQCGRSMLKLAVIDNGVVALLDTWSTKLVSVEELDCAGLPDIFHSLSWSSAHSKATIAWNRITIETIKTTIPGPQWMRKYDCHRGESTKGYSIETFNEPLVGPSCTKLIEDMGSISVQEALDISRTRDIQNRQVLFPGCRLRAVVSDSNVEILDSQTFSRSLGVVPFGAIVVVGSRELKKHRSACMVSILPEGAVDLNMFEPVPATTPCNFSDPDFVPAQMLCCPLCNSYFINATVVTEIMKHTAIPLSCSCCHKLIDTAQQWPCLVCTNSIHQSAFYIVCTTCAPPQIPREKFPRRVAPYNTRKRSSPI